MHVALLTYGTRGDVQPFVALAQGLQAAGHTVRLAAPERLAPLAAPQGIPFVPLAGDPAQLIQGLIEKAGGNPFRIVRVGMEFVFPLAGRVVGGLREACRGADVIVHSFFMVTGGHALAQEQNIPDLSLQLFPVFAPTRAFPAPAFPPLPLGAPYNYLTHSLVTFLFWRIGHAGYGWLKRSSPAFPQKLAWPFAASERMRTPRLFAFSPVVVPRPTDWGPDIHLTGFLTAEAASDWQPPEHLARFLAAGPPPVCINFGSMVTRDLERAYGEVLTALAGAGQRGVIVTGWGGWRPAALPAEVLVLEAAPHEWLFPRMRAIVHHGGAGTTAAALRAGIPSLVVPFAADQPFWGQRVAELKVGPPPLPIRQLNAARLAAALKAAVESADMRARAAVVGRQLRAEDGVARAVELIERHVEAFTARR